VDLQPYIEVTACTATEWRRRAQVPYLAACRLRPDHRTQERQCLCRARHPPPCWATRFTPHCSAPFIFPSAGQCTNGFRDLLHRCRQSQTVIHCSSETYQLVGDLYRIVAPVPNCFKGAGSLANSRRAWARTSEGAGDGLGRWPLRIKATSSMMSARVLRSNGTRQFCTLDLVIFDGQHVASRVTICVVTAPHLLAAWPGDVTGRKLAPATPAYSCSLCRNSSAFTFPKRSASAFRPG
jgi:hypothetical protein